MECGRVFVAGLLALVPFAAAVPAARADEGIPPDVWLDPQTCACNWFDADAQWPDPAGLVYDREGKTGVMMGPGERGGANYYGLVFTQLPDPVQQITCVRDAIMAYLSDQMPAGELPAAIIECVLGH